MAVKAENTRIVTTVTKKLKIELEKRAVKENRTLSNMVATILNEEISKNRRNKTWWKSKEVGERTELEL